MKQKSRLDKLLVARGLATSREKAQAYIIAGKVLVDDQKVEKPGCLLVNDVNIRLKGKDHPYVSRGGLKLEKALVDFNIDVQYQIAMDIGSSTGGFTDCLLQHGASYIFAIDVGHGQLDWKLVTDKRVKNMEKTNFRYLTLADIGSFVDFIAIDVSFISLTKILQNCLNFLKSGGNLVALIKPQFEAGKKNIHKGGIVRDPQIRSRVIDSIKAHAELLGYEVRQIKPSPIQGKKSGNHEYLIHLFKPASCHTGAVHL
jgi:23S rRNA (cytidine1920-2'-O)/16S rRNA (cytidine1409-2'-O)-methyltransferase